MSKRKCDGLAQLINSYDDENDTDYDDREEESNENTVQNDSKMKEETSRENGREDVKRAKKTKEDLNKQKVVSLPLPEGVLKMFNEEDTNDEPKNTDGRVRSFEHFPGNWALHIYTLFPAATCLGPVINALVNSLPVAMATTMHMFPLGELHISLSRTVPVRHYWIDPIVEQLKEKTSLKHRFNCIIESPHLYVNDEKTRSFLGLKISTGEEKLRSIVSVVDDVFDGFSLPNFYENPSFHVSVAWCVGDIFTQITKYDEDRLKDVFDTMVTELSHSLMFDVHEVRCKVGNKQFSFPLAEW